MTVILFSVLLSTVTVKITGAPPFPLFPDSVETGNEQIAELRDNALQWYLQEGYPFAAVAMYFSHPDTLIVNTVPGRHAMLEEVRFPDSVRTDHSLLLREMSLHPGSLYDPQPVAEWLSAIQRYPFIESAGPAAVALGPGGNIVLLVPVHEAPPGWFSGDLDFSSSGGFTGGGEIVFTSIMGTGRRLELSASAVDWGGVDAAGLYREPWILGSPVSAQAQIEQQVPDSGSVIREWSGSVILSLGNADISGGAGTWKSWPADQPEESYRYGSAGIALDYTTRCRQGRRGFMASVTTEAGSAAGADSAYLLTRAETQMSYHGYTGVLGLGASLNAGGIVSGEWLPSMVTRLGGYGTLRGYVKDTFRAGAWGIVSPEVSLGETQTQLYLFSDIGALKTAEEGMRYPVSTGLGIRGTTGGLRFDAGSGFPLNQGLSSARFYLSAVINL
ncbi:MAG: hypothetical protein B1H09_03845 [Gemmatimonadaceae bacterium 4484_173]|nr:MAG: hypothetical protein B1H09_03845 [Gemmatimonadaceae bacterium 4484_173]RKZ02504.1 MAG: hypothetical protein DRQ21_08485 [Candidatus Fermentibacteria bacterium]